MFNIKNHVFDIGLFRDSTTTSEFAIALTASQILYYYHVC